MKKPIGVFDSGIGGLTCLKPLKRLLPDEEFIYFGDSERAPYGTRPVEEIRQFSVEIAENLVAQGCKMLVIACNTISCNAMEQVKTAVDVPVIGVVKPAEEYIARHFAGKRVGTIATKATVASPAYSMTIKKSASEFVPLIEAGRLDEMDPLIHQVLDDFVADNKLEVLVLGCTHFPYIKEKIEAMFPGLIVFDPAEALAQRVKECLEGRA